MQVIWIIHIFNRLFSKPYRNTVGWLHCFDFFGAKKIRLTSNFMFILQKYQIVLVFLSVFGFSVVFACAYLLT
jgi:hypothetical protein